MVAFLICHVIEENLSTGFVVKRLFPDKASKKHWKQQLTVKTLVHPTKGNRNMQGVLVSKSNLVLLKNGNCWRQCYQCFNLKPQKGVASFHGYHFKYNLKIYLLFMSAIAHNWSFFTIFKENFWSPSAYRDPLSVFLNWAHAWNSSKCYGACGPCTCFKMLKSSDLGLSKGCLRLALKCCSCQRLLYLFCKSKQTKAFIFFWNFDLDINGLFL